VLFLREGIDPHKPDPCLHLAGRAFVRRAFIFLNAQDWNHNRFSWAIFKFREAFGRKFKIEMK